MKHNYYLLAILLIVTTSAFAQSKCFTVYDSINFNALSYVNIWKNNKIYANSDVNGKFCIKDADINDYFTISYVGYKTKHIDVISSSILLKRENVDLDEVVIFSPKENKKTRMGRIGGVNLLLTATYDLQIAEAGKVFNLDENKQLYLKKVKFKTFTYEPDRTIGLKIYSLNKDNEPDLLLTKEQIVITVEKGNNTVSYDFEGTIMPVPKNGFFVSLQIFLIEENRQYGVNNKEWFFYDPSIGAKKQEGEAPYFTQTEKGIWKKHPNCDLRIEVFLTD